MKKIPGHSASNFQDKESISFVENILAGHKAVMPKLDSIDKWPNIDGFVEIQEDGSFFGRLHVQVKTLPKDHDLKFTCPIPFLEYCKVDPTILLCVDNDKENIYWIYIDEEYLSSISYKVNQSNKTLYLKDAQVINKANLGYISKWKAIAEYNIRIKKEYPDVRKSYDLISKTGNSIIGLEGDKFGKMHCYLDYLNSNLDGKLRTIKDILYPDQWKLGLAYSHYEDSSLEYLLYSIPTCRNDSQIKELTTKSEERLKENGIQISIHGGENPIQSRPIGYAKEFLKKKTMECLELRLLNHVVSNKTLAREYIFAFIDRIHEPMGMQVKDEYSIEEIKNGCNYLSVWLKKCFDLLYSSNKNNFKDRVHNGRIQYFDPDWNNELSENERVIIHTDTLKHLSSGLQIPALPIGTRKFKYRIFLDFINSTEEESIQRPYIRSDYSRGSWVWSMFSKEDSLKNLETIMLNLPSIYEEFISSNFPELLSELHWMEKQSDTLLVHFNLRDEYLKYEGGPGYYFYYLKSFDKIEPNQIILLNDDEFKDLEKIIGGRFPKGKFSFRGNLYEAISIHRGCLDFLYDEAPLLELMYKILTKKMEIYFQD